METQAHDSITVPALDARERRVLGTLIEKALTTPQQYPLSLNSLVAGTNQKSNRDPVTSYTDEQLDEVLEQLRHRGLVTSIFPASGRTEKFRQELTSVLDLDGPSKGIVGELLLRGPQTLGELRQRASRMVNIPDLGTLDRLLDQLMHRQPPLVVRLTPPGIRRGVRVTHNFYPSSELERVRAAEPALSDGDAEEGHEGGGEAQGERPARATSLASGRGAELEARLAALEARLQALEDRLQE